MIGMDKEKKKQKQEIKKTTIGAIVAELVILALSAIYGVLSGSFTTVWLFCKAHPKEALIWCVLVFVIGFSIGLFARIVMMKRKGITAEHIAELEAKNKELSKLNDKRLKKQLEAEGTLRGMLRGLTPEGMKTLDTLLNNDNAYLDVLSPATTALARIGFIVPLEDLSNPDSSGYLDFMLTPEYRNAIMCMPYVYCQEYKRIVGEYPESSTIDFSPYIER